jgi:ribonuclease HIII
MILQTSKETEVAVNVASILAKYVFEKEVDKLNKFYNIDLRKATPSEIDPQILPQVAKIHFKNVRNGWKTSGLEESSQPINSTRYR